jgi:hypothetical protein
LDHCPIRLPAWKLSVANVASAASGGSTGRVECDHEHPGLLGLVQRRDDRLGVVRRDHEALGARGDQVLDGLHLGLVVAVLLAREGLQLHARLLGGLGRASFILTKNGLVSVLVIRPTITSSPEAAAPGVPDPLELDDPPPQAASTREAVRPVAITAARRPRGEMGFRTVRPLVFSTGNRPVDNVVGGA